MKTEFLPCPFCGGSELVVQKYASKFADWYYKVECMDCEIRGKAGASPDEAVVAWNTRVASQKDS